MWNNQTVCIKISIQVHTQIVKDDKQIRFNGKIWCSAHSADPDSRKFAFMPRNVRSVVSKWTILKIKMPGTKTNATLFMPQVKIWDTYSQIQIQSGQSKVPFLKTQTVGCKIVIRKYLGSVNLDLHMFLLHMLWQSTWYFLVVKLIHRYLLS